jgi:murein DD-endopeptidase MepM/ murein hydrolase activator NlpD
MLNPNEFFSVVFVPPGGKQSVSFRLTRVQFNMFVIFTCFVVFGIGMFIYFSLYTSFDAREYKELQLQAQKQKEEIHRLQEEVDGMKDTIGSIIEKESVINSILGESIRKTRRYRRSVRESKNKSSRFDRSYKGLASASADSEKTAFDSSLKKVTFYKSHLQKMEESFTTHLENVQFQKDLYAYTPSILPLYGSIRSGYGMRNHPLTGHRRFHRGIDIPSWVGAPIRSTADGVVIYSGWARAFGNIVVIRHNMGFMTKYAHASKTLVNKGDFVKKGQVIAQIGQTGLSTGPHVHYEVLRWNKHVNPSPYLDLDIFTASTKIW